ncbi:MAG: hypothetical protein ACXABY_33390, partial [Candidatus Thorarchaeota archaeon]
RKEQLAIVGRVDSVEERQDAIEGRQSAFAKKQHKLEARQKDFAKSTSSKLSSLADALATARRIPSRYSAHIPATKRITRQVKEHVSNMFSGTYDPIEYAEKIRAAWKQYGTRFQDYELRDMEGELLRGGKGFNLEHYYQHPNNIDPATGKKKLSRPQILEQHGLAECGVLVVIQMFPLPEMLTPTLNPAIVDLNYY